MSEGNAFHDTKAFYEAVATIVSTMCQNSGGDILKSENRGFVANAVLEVGAALAKAEKEALRILNE